EIRAHRRATQLRNKGVVVDEQELLDQITQRDKEDSERTVAPLVVAPDARIIDSTGMSVEEVVNLMLRTIQENPCCSSC
ncbi:MAG: (d)CMP kinase, partial [Desulfobulbus sp.]|nr:(d)CMP kinase [Desulfobulbus sp.]